MGEYRPIETRYRGYRFRSRLEARWAIFFDALGVRWRYETEGMVLAEEHGGLCYLPDFYLPDWDLFIEVKPDLPRDDVYHEASHEPGQSCDHGLLVASSGSELTVTGKFIVAAAELETKDTAGRSRPRLYMACGTPYPPVLDWDGFWKLHDGAVLLSLTLIPGRGPLLPMNAWSTSEDDDSLDIWPLYFDGRLRGDPEAALRLGAPSAHGERCIAPVFPCMTMTRLYIGPGRSFASPRLRRAYEAARGARFDRRRGRRG